MKLLAVDTASAQTSFVVLEEGALLIEGRYERGAMRGDTIFQALSDALDERDMTVSDIEAFAVCTGPGSFTGLRVGLGLAKTLAFVLERPVFGIDAVEVVARRMIHSGMDIPRGEFRAAIVSFKDTVFAARFIHETAGLESRRDLDWFESPSAFLKEVGVELPIYVPASVADGVAGAIAVDDAASGAEIVGLAAADRIRRGITASFESVQPNYLKPFGIGKKAATLEDMR